MAVFLSEQECVYFTRNDKFLLDFFFNEKWNVRQTDDKVLVWHIGHFYLKCDPHTPLASPGVTVSAAVNMHWLESDTPVTGRGL